MTNDRTATAARVEHDQVPAVGAAPAPWSLEYEAVMVLLRARTPQPRRGLLGRFSAVMFVDYRVSKVGPYRELLHLSPIARWPDAIGPSVTDIWVTSQASAEWGNHNWGLTKSVASIERQEPGDGSALWEVADEHGPLATLRHRPHGPSLPTVKPGGLGRLVQQRYGNVYRTPVAARAAVRLTKVESITLAPRFVDLEQHRVVGAAAVPHGTMDFLAAHVTPLR